jgi:hypothetical protein
MTILKIPNTSKVKLWFIKKLIKTCDKEKLYGILGILEQNPDDENTPIIYEYLRKEFKKRNYPIDF